MTRPLLAVLVLLALAAPAAADPPPSLAFLQTAEDETDLATYTFAAQNFGAAESNRQIIVTIGARKSGATTTLSSVTVGGITATITRQQAASSSSTSLAAIVIATVPTGTSGSVVVTFAGTMVRCAIGVYRAEGLRLVATSAASSTATAPTTVITIPKNGFAVGAAVSAASGTTTWTGLTEDADALLSTMTYTAAHTAVTTAEDRTITATFSAALDSAGVFAAWAPIVPGAITHWVTPAGSGSSSCTQAIPCTITRAAALIGTATMPPGSIVLLQCNEDGSPCGTNGVDDGIYSQPVITWSGSGLYDRPIQFRGEDGVRMVGTRDQIPASAWTKLAGFTNIWEADWSDTTDYAVTHMAQRKPVTTWQPIVVDDRQPPFSSGSGRVFTLVEPIDYKVLGTSALVDAQHCTFTYLGSTDKIRVHMCHDGAPTDADRIFVGTNTYGSWIIDGSFLRFDNIDFEQVLGASSVGLLINSASTGVQFTNSRFMATSVWAQGRSSLFDHVTIDHVYQQGPLTANCYDADPTFGVGECWNDDADGRALTMGKDDTGISYNSIFRNGFISRSWNLSRIIGRNHVENTIFYGASNHGMEIAGTGVTSINNVFTDSQDSIYLEGSDWDRLVIEHNLISGGTAWWTSRDLACAGCIPPTAWRVKYNILPSMLYEDLTYTTVVADCQVWMPKSASPSSVIRILGTDGAAEVGQWTTLAAAQAATSLETNSFALAYTGWADGTRFLNFKGGQLPAFDDPAFDYWPVLKSDFTVCGILAGPYHQITDKARARIAGKGRH